MALARSERMLLCDLMLEPARRRRCASWSVIDLAAHLVVGTTCGRLGHVVGGPSAHARTGRGADAPGPERLVETSAALPASTAWSLPAPSSPSSSSTTKTCAANGSGAPRARRADEALARLIRATGARLLSRVESGVDVVWNGGVLYRHGAEPRAVLSGPPGELILYLMGRRSAARVQLSGDSAAVEALEKAKLGI